MITGLGYSFSIFYNPLQVKSAVIFSSRVCPTRFSFVTQNDGQLLELDTLKSKTEKELQPNSRSHGPFLEPLFFPQMFLIFYIYIKLYKI